MSEFRFPALKSVALCCLIGVLIITAGCIGQNTSAQPQEQTLVVAGPADFDGCEEIQASVYDTFLDISANGKPIPGLLIDSWEASNNGETYTFHLNRGVEFHDGTQWNGTTAKWFFEWCRSGPRSSEVAFTKIADVRRVNNETIQVDLKEPYGAFIKTLASEYRSYVVAPTSVEPAWNTDGKIVSFIGTGPFRVEEYVKGQRAELVRVDQTSGRDILIDRIAYRIIPDSHASVAALRAGDVDIIGATDHHACVPYEQVPLMMSDPNIVVEKQSYGRYQVVELNCREGPLSDIRIREALNYGLDREKMVKELLASAAEPAYSVVSPVYPFASSLAGKGYTYDPEKAKELLNQAGWIESGGNRIREKNGKKLTLKYVVAQGEANAESIAVYLQSEMKKIGVEINIITMESGAASEARTKSDYDMYLHHSYGVPGLPDGPLTGKYHSTWGWPAAYHDAELDRLIEHAISTDGNEDYSRAYLYIQEKYACLPLYDIEKLVAHKKSVTGFIFPDSVYRANFSSVSIES